MNFALDIQSKLVGREKLLEEKRRRFNDKIYELDQEKQRVITEHESFKCENAEERHQLSKLVVSHWRVSEI